MKTTLQIIGILAIAGSISFAEGDRKRDRKGGILEKLDTDGNGAISKTEFLAGDRAKENPERAEEAFKRMDADGNGEITADEMGGGREGGGGKRPNPGQIFKKLDADESGSISEAEFMNGERSKKNPEMAAKAFDRLDANDSGDITRDEFKIRPKRGGGGGKRPDDNGGDPVVE